MAMNCCSGSSEKKRGGNKIGENCRSGRGKEVMLRFSECG